MMLTLTEEEMLTRWRLLTLLEPMAPAGAIAGREDYTPLRQLCLLRMRAWYEGLLDAADPTLVPVTDIRGSCRLYRANDHWLMELPEGTRRVLSVRLAGWSRPETPVTPDEATECSNPYISGSCGNPQVVRLSPTRLLINGPVTDVTASTGEVMATMLPADGSYILDEKALGLISAANIP